MVPQLSSATPCPRTGPYHILKHLFHVFTLLSSSQLPPPISLLLQGNVLPYNSLRNQIHQSESVSVFLPVSHQLVSSSSCLLPSSRKKGTTGSLFCCPWPWSPPLQAPQWHCLINSLPLTGIPPVFWCLISNLLLRSQSFPIPTSHPKSLLYRLFYAFPANFFFSSYPTCLYLSLPNLHGYLYIVVVIDWLDVSVKQFGNK